MPRPSIKSPCTADHYADKSKERIAEFSAAKTEAGGLISLTEREDGLHLSVYNLTKTVVHIAPADLGPQSLRAAAKLWAEQNPGESPDIFKRLEESTLVDTLLRAIENVETLPLGKGYNGSHVQALKHTAACIRAARAKAEPVSDPRFPEVYNRFDDNFEASRLIKDHGPVALSLEKGEKVTIVARFATIADAEAFIEASDLLDPADVEAGRYGIDAPHGVGSDDEAIPLAIKLGFDVFMSMGGAYYSKGPHRSDCKGWVGRVEGSTASFDNAVEAAHAANSTIEP